MPVTLGNDIVDLAQARNQLENRRFLDRVFSLQEQSFIAGSHFMLWTLWAMKEAAFKAYQKQNLHRIFSPIACQVRHLASQADGIKATVLIDNKPISCHARLCDKNATVHCVASYQYTHSNYRGTQGSTGSIYEKIKKIAHSDHPSQSQAVRILAQALFEEINLVNAVIHRPLLDMGAYRKKAPPQVLIDGKVSDCDLSLSHDGHYVAVVLGIFR